MNNLDKLIALQEKYHLSNIYVAFMIAAFPDCVAHGDEEYMETWAQRFQNGRPEMWMDEIRGRKYCQVLYKDHIRQIRHIRYTIPESI